LPLSESLSRSLPSAGPRQTRAGRRRRPRKALVLEPLPGHVRRLRQLDDGSVRRRHGISAYPPPTSAAANNMNHCISTTSASTVRVSLTRECQLDARGSAVHESHWHLPCHDDAIMIISDAMQSPGPSRPASVTVVAAAAAAAASAASAGVRHVAAGPRKPELRLPVHDSKSGPAGGQTSGLSSQVALVQDSDHRSEVNRDL
jgi:hypothetical protein